MTKRQVVGYSCLMTQHSWGRPLPRRCFLSAMAVGELGNLSEVGSRGKAGESRAEREENWMRSHESTMGKQEESARVWGGQYRAVRIGQGLMSHQEESQEGSREAIFCGESDASTPLYTGSDLVVGVYVFLLPRTPQT